MESYPTQAVLPLIGLAAEKVIRDRYISGLFSLLQAVRGPYQVIRVYCPRKRGGRRSLCYSSG
ncbi:MAG: hypothetical protein ACQESR_20155 [Planctomycetota bacterium]